MNSKSDNRGAAARQPTEDKFTRNQFDWLRQVAFDGGLSPAASRVAIALTRYFNREHAGAAWMSQATLATDLGMPVRTVGRALSGLVKRGHLVTKRRGKMETNTYHLALKNGESDRPPMTTHDRPSVATHTGVIGQNEQSDRPKPAEVIGHQWPTNPLKEPLEEPIEGRVSIQLDPVDEDSGRRGRSPSETNADFEKFYWQYPKHVAKTAAFRAYRAVINKKLATPEELLAGAMRYAAERSGQDPKYTKHANTWLNGGCWDDEPSPIGTTPRQPESPHIAIAAEIARELQAKQGGGNVH